MIKKLNISDLDLGMFVVELDRAWSETPFLFHTKLVSSADTIDKFRNFGIKYVYIDTSKGKDASRGVSQEEVDKQITEEIVSHAVAEKKPIKVPSNEEYRNEMVRAVRVKQEASSVVTTMMHDVRMGKSIDKQKVELMAGDMVESSLRNPDALLSLSRLKSFDNYTFVHCVNVSILTLSLGRAMSLSDQELKDITVGGMIHDLGKMRVPQNVLNKPGKLTDDEFSVMKSHVQLGHDYAQTLDNVAQSSIDVLYQHHERIDGTGYPRGLKGDGLSLYGQLATIADVYDAITSRRIYHEPMSPFEGLKKMYEWSGGHFKREYVEAFVRFLGLYPAGTLVKLSGNKLAVVWKVNREALNRPVVNICYDSAKEVYIRPKLVDLNDPALAEIAITGVENSRKWNIDVEKFVS